MKRIIVGILVLFMLSGCGISNDSATQNNVTATVNGEATQDVNQYIQDDLNQKLNEALNSDNQSTSNEQNNIRSQYNFPLEIRYKSKEYKEYANAETLSFYFSIRNNSTNDLKTPACDIDFLDKNGNVVYSNMIFHNGVLKSGQESEDFIPIYNDEHAWEDREKIVGINILNYYDEDNAPYTLDNPIAIPFS